MKSTYTLPHKARDKLRALLPDMPDNKFNAMILRIEEKADAYFRLKAWLETDRKKPSAEVKNAKAFKYYAEGLVNWLEKNESIACDWFFAGSAISVDEIKSSLRGACGNADNCIEEIIEQSNKPRHEPTQARQLLLWDMAAVFESATGKQPTVSDYVPYFTKLAEDSDDSADCLHGEFLEFSEIILNAVGVHLARHTLFDQIRRMRSAPDC